LLAERRYATGFEDIVAVSGAIIYDYFGRRNSVYPDKALGRAAARTARPGRFPLGRGGAGHFAACGGLFTPEPAGWGGAFREMGQIKVAAFVVINSLGAILDRSGRVVKGAPGLRRWPRVVAEIERRIADGDAEVPPFGNTTLAVVVTKRRMSQAVLAHFGRQLHASLARAVQPFHSAFDGDALYAITTGESPEEPSDDTRLGIVASEVAWDAILSIP
jgi:L-aminopeptidase/D-esterase-like protein